MMGYANRLAVEVTYARAFAKARHLRAYVALCKIADRIPDDVDPAARVYWHGASELAYAMGLTEHGTLLSPAMRVAVSKAIAQCVRLGALERVGDAFTGQRAEYRLVLPDVLPTPVDNRRPRPVDNP